MAVCAALFLVAAGGEDTLTANAAPPPHSGTNGNHGNHGKQGVTSDAALELHDAMRKLWEDHITWTRLFIVSDAANIPDLQATTDRLLRNQEDIGNAITPYYGEAAGEQLTALLREHILLAADILNAAKNGDSAAQQDATAKWYANADDIARFVSNANPSQWGFGEMRQMMRTHLDLTLKEAVAHLTGDFAGDVAAYDAVHDEILEMADMLSSGIVAQFPDRF
ncbi:MAG: acetylglutamate kinase [Hyphomicrobiales bacterium]